jgi:hypothetical protein
MAEMASMSSVSCNQVTKAGQTGLTGIYLGQQIFYSQDGFDALSLLQPGCQSGSDGVNWNLPGPANLS